MKDDRIMKRLPERELEIMQIIWRETPPVSRMTVEDALQKAHSLAPTTILTLLTRLCGKGFSFYGERRPYESVCASDFRERISGGREQSVSGQAVPRICGGIRRGALRQRDYERGSGGTGGAA